VPRSCHDGEAVLKAQALNDRFWLVTHGEVEAQGAEGRGGEVLRVGAYFGQRERFK
jgi:hypothetical protein